MEIRVIRKVTRMHDHPNICKTYHSFADNILVFLVMEYLGGGSLMERIKRKGHYHEADASNVVFQIASALKELHSSGIVLCDINPTNLLYERTDNETIKVAEFGRAQIMPGPAFVSQTRILQQQDGQQQQNGNEEQMPPKTSRRRNPVASLSSFVTNQQIVGAPGYIAPEILSHKQYSTACDVYALGCVAFAMLTGVSPLLGCTDPTKPPTRTAFDQVLADANVSSEARDLIAGMTHPDRSKRIAVSQVLEHAWVVSPPRRPGMELSLFPRHAASFNRPLRVRGSSFEENARRKLHRALLAVQFAVRIARSAKSKNDVVVRAQPPPPLVFNLIDSRRSTETSSGGVSQLELRNQWLTLDGYAQRVRSENRLDELSPIFKHTAPVRGNSSASGFTGVGISSSVAGQLYELGGDTTEDREPIRPAGPFLAALEAHLEAEAGLVSSSSSDQDENSKDEDEEDEDEEMITTTSVASNPQGPSKFDAETSRIKVAPIEKSDSTEPLGLREDDEEEEPVSPKTARESAVRAWEAMVRENEIDDVE